MAKMTKSTMSSKMPIKKAVNSPLMAMKVGKKAAPKMAGGIKKSKGK